MEGHVGKQIQCSICTGSFEGHLIYSLCNYALRSMFSTLTTLCNSEHLTLSFGRTTFFFLCFSHFSGSGPSNDKLNHALLKYHIKEANAGGFPDIQYNALFQ